MGIIGKAARTGILLGLGALALKRNEKPLKKAAQRVRQNAKKAANRVLKGTGLNVTEVPHKAKQLKTRAKKAIRAVRKHAA